jgi:hypothetical protein
VSYPFGQPVTLAINITAPSSDPNVLGAPANAGAVVATITLPDGSTTQPAVTNPSTGYYTFTYLPTQYGRHSVVWLATGVNSSAIDDEFNVDHPLPLQLVSVADVKRQMRVTWTDGDDDLLTDYIVAATEIVEDLCGPMVRRQIVGEYVELIGRTVWNEITVGVREFVLRERPVVSVDAVVSAISSGVVYTATDFIAEASTGIVRRLDNGTMYGPLRVDYTVGRTYVPRAVAVAVGIIVEHLWQSTRGGGGRIGVPGPGGQDAAGQVSSYYAIPNRALQLLQPYKRVPAVG